MFIILKTDYYQLWFLNKSNFRISTAGKHVEIKYNLPLLNLEKRQYLPFYRSDKGLTGTAVNWALSSLNKGSLEITLSVPFHQY